MVLRCGNSVTTAALLRWALAAALLGALVAVFGLRHPRIDNESVDYMSIAYNMASGHGFVTDIRWHFFTPGPANHPAFGERQPAYPAFLAAGLQIKRSDGMIHSATATLMYATCAALTLLAGVAFGVGAAAATALIVPLCPVAGPAMLTVLPSGLFVLTEALGIVAALTARRRWEWGVVCGLLLAITCLSRGEGFVVSVVVLLWLARHNRRSAAAAAAALCLALVPNIIAAKRFRVRGPSVQSFHLRVERLADGMWYGYGKRFPSALSFIASKWRYVGRKVGRNVLIYVASLIKASWLGVGFAVLAIMAMLARRPPPEAALISIAGGAQVLAAAIVWSTTTGAPEPEQHAALGAVLLMPLVGWAIAQAWAVRRLAGLAVLAVTLAVYLPTDASLLASQPDLLRQAAAAETAAASGARWVGPDDTVASSHPWLVWYLLRRPAVILPKNLGTSDRLRFLNDYRVRLIVDRAGETVPWLFTPGVATVFNGGPSGWWALTVRQKLAKTAL
ncbi:MAG: hypothetical protein H5T86_03645 [Armatimonadetes bacterium]|nr:hypothetical protein [Armatimonadota bacterium]